MIPARHILVTGFLLLLSAPLLMAQPREASDWFLRQIFLLSDFNGDGQLSRAEAAQAPPQWDYYSAAAGFSESDLDGDQLLSRSEMEQTAWKALVFRLSQDEQDLRRLQRDFSHLHNAQSKYLERYPGLATKLLGNVVWCRENSLLVKKLLKNRSWLREQPEVADALQNNLIFWVEHPQIAEQYYVRPPAGNDAALYEAWRTGHRRYLNTLGSIPDKSILDFRHYEQSSDISDKDATPLTIVPPPESPSEVARLSNSEQVDSLKAQLKAANEEIQQLERMLEVVNRLPAVQELDQQSLEDELRMLQIELQLARIEEDSLMAERIRNRRLITHLKGRLTADSLAASGRTTDPSENIASLEQEIRQLRGFISSQAVEMEALNTKLRQTQNSLVVEQEKLAQLSRIPTTEQAGAQQGVDQLVNRVQVQTDSLIQYEERLRRMTAINRSQRLRNDSLRLELVQSGVRRQAVMDSLHLLLRISRIQSDSIAYWSALASSQLENESDDSLLNALQRSERLRIVAVRRYQASLDSMERMIDLSKVNTSTSNADIAFRDGSTEQFEEIIDDLKAAQEGLVYDNNKLRQQLEATMVVSREQESVLKEQLSAVLKNNRRLEYQNRKLQRRVTSRKLLAPTTAIARMDEANFELTEARTQISELESLNERLLMQLQTTQGYILQKLREEGNINDRLISEMQDGAAAKFQADTLSIALANALRNSWPDTVAMLRAELKEVVRQKESLQLNAVAARSHYLQQRDSLVEVIDARDLELIRSNRVQNVDEQRF